MEKAIMEKSKVVKTDQPAANMMGRLPQEIILRILSRLPITSLVQSKLVCRAWRSLIRDPLLVSQHFSQMADNDPSFILQSLRRAPYDQLYFTDFSDFSEGKVISMKPDNSSMLMSLEDSCNVLLCMRDSRGIYICNPFTRLSMELPKFINYPPGLGHLEFGFNPTKKEYKPCLEKSKVHWLSKPNKNTTASLLASFDLATEQFQGMHKPDCCVLDRCFHDLMVVRGCLSAGGYHDNEQLEIWVMKEHSVKNSWIKEFTIGTYLPRTLQQNDLLHFNNARA